jgi:hypothetical protein
MSCTSITCSTFPSSRSISAETLATLHDTARTRAQTLRREAIAALIDDAIAWLKASMTLTRRATSAGR